MQLADRPTNRAIGPASAAESRLRVAVDRQLAGPAGPPFPAMPEPVGSSAIRYPRGCWPPWRCCRHGRVVLWVTPPCDAGRSNADPIVQSAWADVWDFNPLLPLWTRALCHIELTSNSPRCFASKPFTEHTAGQLAKRPVCRRHDSQRDHPCATKGRAFITPARKTHDSALKCRLQRTVARGIEPLPTGLEAGVLPLHQTTNDRRVPDPEAVIESSCSAWRCAHAWRGRSPLSHRARGARGVRLENQVIAGGSAEKNPAATRAAGFTMQRP